MRIVIILIVVLAIRVHADWQPFNNDYFNSIGAQDFTSPNSPFGDLTFANGQWHLGGTDLTGQDALNRAYQLDGGWSAVGAYLAQSATASIGVQSPEPASAPTGMSGMLVSVTASVVALISAAVGVGLTIWGCRNAWADLSAGSKG